MARKKRGKKTGAPRPRTGGNRWTKLAGFLLLFMGILVVFISSALNTVQNHDMRAGRGLSSQVYIFDLVSTLGVVIIPLGLYLLLKKEEKAATVMPAPSCAVTAIDETSYSYMRWN
jgi:uncharacterized membrane protein